jgi:hypothetical protein
VIHGWGARARSLFETVELGGTVDNATSAALEPGLRFRQLDVQSRIRAARLPAYDGINEFESQLVDDGIVVVKHWCQGERGHGQKAPQDGLAVREPPTTRTHATTAGVMLAAILATR